MNTISKWLTVFALLSASMAANAQLTGPSYPPPGGNTLATVGSDAITPGGLTWTYGGFNPTQYSALYYVVDAVSAGYGPCLGINACDTLTYNSSLSNLAAGTLYFTGSTAPGGFWTELAVQITSSPGSSPLALTAAASIPGIPSVDGAALNVTGDFNANYQMFLASSCGGGYTGCNWSNASGVFNNWEESNHFSGNALQSNFGGGFYSTAPVPLPASVWLMLSGLVGVGAMARKRRAV